MSKLVFSIQEMQNYLESFNVSYMKYFGKNQLPNEYKNEQIVKCMEDIMFADLKGEKCSATELSDVYEIVNKVYGSKKEAQNDVRIYQMVSEKFIREFVGIEGLDTLYKPLFFVFEWLMHLEYKPERNKYSYYRDHFIHQIRNMVEMLMLLTNDELELRDHCINALKKGKTPLAILMKETVYATKNNTAGMSEINVIAENVRGKEGEERKAVQEQYIENAIYTYILLGSAVVTSTLHDIGYPIEFINGNLSRMDTFLPASQFFFEKKDKTSKMHRILQDSLLYRTMSAYQIAEKVRSGDHGAISACILLMKYYENGKIFSLPPIQRMIIELSAVTIFEHTLKYESIGTGHDRYQISFEENPFSYLFRLCDDIEEWDRTYFEITDQSNFLLCKKCDAIINRMKLGYTDELRHYECGCGEKGINNNIFNYRKLTSVNVCQYVEIEVYSVKKVKTVYRIKLMYDLMALLQASAYSETFAAKRAEALREIKKMTYDQSGILPMYIDSFISNNPILIKTEILSRFLKGKDEKWLDKILDEIMLKEMIKDRLDYLWNDSIYYDVLNYIPFRKRSKMVGVQRENILLYMKLLVLAEILCMEKDIMRERYIYLLLKEYLTISNSLEILIEDCLKQRFLAVSIDTFIKEGWEYIEQYFNMYIVPKNVNFAVKSYISSSMYDQVRMRVRNEKKEDKKYKDCHYDFYSDYGIFLKMYENID